MFKQKLIPLIISILLMSFTQVAISQTNGDIMKLARDGDELFVITADSVKHTGSKFSTPWRGYPPRFFEVDGVKYKRKDGIIAYQDKTAYTACIPGIGDAHRYKKGKINLYEYTYMSQSAYGAYSHYSWYLEKEKGVYKLATRENMETMFADNPTVVAKFNEYFPNKKSKNTILKTPGELDRDLAVNIQDLVDMYNK